MKRHVTALVLTACVSATLAWSLRPALAQEKSYRGVLWEHRVFPMDPAEYTDKSDYRLILEREGQRKVDGVFREYVLNHLGSEGWELISVEQRSRNLVYFYLKRRKL